ncbi:MAG: hypothetical protein J1E36_05055 [Eubacterium sp.]|nr:hypothetical protein [Eubacterium sp.]
MREKITTGKIYCLTAVAIILGSYIIQRILHITLDITREFAIIEAIVFTVATVIVFFLVTKSKETFYGILTAIFGLRMMPPDISSLAKLSPEANIVYFIVQKFSLLIFAVAILWLYEQQEKPKQLKAVPILCTILVVPFFMDVQGEISVYINSIANGNLIYSYFTGFIFYSLSMIILLFVATRSNQQGAKLIIDFQFVALLLNFGRRICAVVINLAQGNHISRSYYCWIAIYIFFFIAFYVLRKKNTTKMLTH